MSIIQLINNIHSAIDREDVLKRIQEILLEFGFSGHFAIFFYNEPLAKMELSDSRGIATGDAAVIEASMNRLYPLSGIYSLPVSGSCNVLCGNLMYRSSPYGVIAVAGGGAEETTEISEELELMFKTIAVALVKQQLYEEADHKINFSMSKIDAINHVASLLRNLDIDPLLANLLEIALSIVKAEVGSILLFNKENELESRVEMGVSEEFLLSLADKQGKPFIKRMIDGAESVLINNAKNDDRLDLTHSERNIKSIICLPLITKAQRLGVIVIVNYVDSFQQSDFEILATIDFLASSAIENTILRMEQAESDRLRQQMILAKQIQESLQAQNIPDFEGVDLDGWCLSCYETGGDYFDFIEFNAHELALVIGDASGHGLGAALMMVGTRAAMKSMFQLGLPLTQVFHEINNRIESDSQSERFMTLFCGVLNTETKTLRYCSAGHDIPLLYRPSDDSIMELDATGIPLGMFSDADYEQHEGIALKSGDILIMSTDGVREAFNEMGQPFGDEGFKALIRETGSSGLSAPEISMKIRSAILNYIHPAPRTDDITVIVAVIK